MGQDARAGPTKALGVAGVIKVVMRDEHGFDAGQRAADASQRRGGRRPVAR